MRCKQCRAWYEQVRVEQAYCSKSCASVEKGRSRRGQKTGPQFWRTYKRRIDKDGYVRVYAGRHPYADGRLMIPEHVMVMELAIRRRLRPGEVVHHRNHDREDNRLENLELMTRSDHSRIHGIGSLRKRSRTEDGRFA